MAKIKVAEAIGPVLDWLVAKCEGMETELIGVKDDNDPIKFWHNTTNQRYQFSTRWDIGGPIIERELIDTLAPRPNWLYWEAYIPTWPRPSGAMQQTHVHYDPTPLIAAMRCYVASKLGDEAEVPDELLGV